MIFKRHLGSNADLSARDWAPTFGGTITFAEFPNVKATMIISCMDGRSDPADYWQLRKVTQPVLAVRTAGGRASDALRSIRVLSSVMAMGENTVGTVAVVHHTDCGLANFDNKFIRNQIRSRNGSHLTQHQLDELEELECGEIKDMERSVREDMQLIMNDPYVPKDLEVVGFVYDTFSGKTTEVII